MAQILRMAKRGRAYLFRPNTRINPIHGADLAEFCVDRLVDSEKGEWNVGGPEVFTWKSLAECAFRALERPAKTTTVSPAILPPLIKVVGVVNPRRADTLRFVTWSMLNDCVGDPVGTHTLIDFYKSHATDKK